MKWRSIANAGKRLVVFADALASPHIRHVRLRHQVPFVTRVGKDAGTKRPPILHPDLGDVSAALRNAVFFTEPMLEKYANAGFLDQIVDHRFGDVWFEVPLDVSSVLGTDALKELERVAADDFLLPVIRPPEAATHHPAQVPSGFEQRDTQSLARRGNGGDDPTSRAAVDDEVKNLRGWSLCTTGGAERGQESNGCEKNARGTQSSHGH